MSITKILMVAVAFLALSACEGGSEGMGKDAKSTSQMQLIDG